MAVINFKTPLEISNDEVRVICSIKSQNWPYTMESQLSWWQKYTYKDDILVTLKGDDSTFGFLRLRQRLVKVSDFFLKAICLTEVCVDKKHQGRGVGRQLMDAAVTQVQKKDTQLGYLLCWDAQLGFYQACGWNNFNAVKIQSLDGHGTRALRTNERCMVYDPLGHLKGELLLIGDVF